MKLIRDALIIAYMKSIPDLKRQPGIIILLTAIAAIPLFFMVLFGGTGMLNMGLVGVIVSTIGFMGIAAPIQDVTWDRYVKLREMIVAMPVHPLSYALGVNLASLIFALPGSLIFLGIGIVRGLFTLLSLLATLGVIVLCWLCLSVMGFAIATYLYRTAPSTLGLIANILAFGFVFLPPVYYSETMLGPYAWVGYLLPTSNAAAVIRYVTGINPMNPGALAAHWLVIAMMAVAFSALAVAKARWRET
ncbi:MAG: hypothetical protein AB1665_05860 [Candidatus Thermoplasmatota archaeon]